MGPSIRYQTSSMRKNAKPTTAAAVSTKRSDEAVEGSTISDSSLRCSRVSAGGRLIVAATAATRRFATAASQMVERVPNRSSSQKVAARQPATAPSVLRP